MSKKTWSTILVVLLVIGAIIGIYFATRKPAAAPEPSPTPVVAAEPSPTPVVATEQPATEVPATEAPTEAPTAEPTEAPTEAPTAEPTEAPTAAPEAQVESKVEEVAAAVAAGAEEVKETGQEAVASAEEKATKVVSAVTAAMTGRQKVTVWHTFTRGQEEYMLKAAKDFNASQDKIEVEMLSQPRAGFEDAVYSAVNEGVGPDIIFNYASEAVKYIPAGLVADLSQYIYDAEIGIEGFDEALDPVILSGEVKGFSDGLIHYVPAYTTGPIYFYNKTLFDELGLAVPTSWEEIAAVSATIFEKKGYPGLGTDGLTDVIQQLIMESENSGYIDAENKKVLFDTPEVRAKLQWLVDLAKKGHVALKPAANYFSDDFNGGALGAFVGSVAGFPYVNLPEGSEFAVAPLPTKDWYPSWNRGPIVFDYKDDARTEAAYQFVKYYISAEVNAGWAEAVVALAPYSWTQENEAYKAFVAQDVPAVAALEAVRVNLDKVGPLANVTGAAQVRRYIEDAVVKAAGGEVTLDAAWDEAVKLSNEALQGN